MVYALIKHPCPPLPKKRLVQWWHMSFACNESTPVSRGALTRIVAIHALSLAVFTSGAFATVAYADQTPAVPTLSVLSQSFAAIPFDKKGVPTGMEAAPWIVKGGWRGYFLTTAYSYFCATPDSLAGSVTLYPEYCAKISEPVASMPWLRNYNGILSSHVLNPSTDPVILAAVHGENKNERIGTTRIQNTVATNFAANPKFDANVCASGINDAGVYEDCWDAYFGFISLAHQVFTPATQYARVPFINDGPIVWPSAGYLNSDGTQASVGVRHPTFFAADGYLYVFYLDMSPASWGIKVARAPLSGQPSAGSFNVYNRDSFNLPALPKGFSNSSIASFYAAKGGPSSCIIGCVGNTVRFSVAAITGTHYYLGVLEYAAADGKTAVALSASSDLVHWSTPVDVRTFASWSQSDMHYPILMDTDGWANTEIDISDFYVVGVGNASNPTRLHISAKVQAPTSTPLPNPVPTPSTPAPYPSVSVARPATTTPPAGPSLLEQILNGKGFRVPALVRTTDKLNARAAAGTSSSVACVLPSGTLGIILGGPTLANGYTWWRVFYLGDCFGWSVQNYLETDWWTTR